MKLLKVPAGKLLKAPAGAFFWLGGFRKENLARSFPGVIFANTVRFYTALKKGYENGEYKWGSQKEDIAKRRRLKA